MTPPDFTSEYVDAQKRKPPMSTKDTLVAFGEWLDGQGLFAPASNEDGTQSSHPHRVAEDDRTHEELAEEFIEFWESRAGTATLAGRLFASALERLHRAAFSGENTGGAK